MGKFGIKHIKAMYDEGFEKTSDVNYKDRYVPGEFWEEYSSIYLDMFIHDEDRRINNLQLNTPALITRLRHIQPESVLEIGCGFGRLLPFVICNVESVKRLVGIEHSKGMIAKSEEYFKMVDRPMNDKFSITQARAQSLPFKDNEFDLVYSHVCLTHIPPEDISQVTSEISRVAKKWILHFERYSYPYEHAGQHRWSHCLPEYYDSKIWQLWENVYINTKHKTCSIAFRRR